MSDEKKINTNESVDDRPPSCTGYSMNKQSRIDENEVERSRGREVECMSERPCREENAGGYGRGP